MMTPKMRVAELETPGFMLARRLTLPSQSTLEVLSSGLAVAQSMTVWMPTSAAGSDEGSPRSACIVTSSNGDKVPLHALPLTYTYVAVLRPYLALNAVSDTCLRIDCDSTISPST